MISAFERRRRHRFWIASSYLEICVLSIELDGSIAWECVKSIDCRSSHETSLKIKSTGGNGEGRATALMIDGNLCKFLQGHNIFGSRDLNALLLFAFRKVVELHGEHLRGCSSPALTDPKIKKGDYKVKMLGIWCALLKPCRLLIRSWRMSAG